MRHHPNTSLTQDSPTQRGQRGFSLIEVLIASLILLFVALGIIPLFTMAAQSNLQGSENTKAANHARERLEQLWQMGFNDEYVTILGGEERAHTEYYDEAAEVWTPLFGAPPAGTLWTRHTVIRQFAVDDLDTPITAEQATADPVRVQLKEMTVEIGTTREAGPFGGGKNITVRAYKAQ